jgi:hypothetical protein
VIKDRIGKAALLLGAAVAVVAGSTGCSALYDTNASQMALHYSGGTGDKQAFVECVNPSSKKTTISEGEHVYYYPVGQRTFKFDATEDKDSDPISVSTSDQEVTSRGVVTFSLTQDCDALRRFHEAVGLKYKAYTGDGTDALDGKDYSAGWRNMLLTYVRNPLEASMDAEGQKYSALDLYNNVDGAAVKWTQAVTKGLPAAVKQLTGNTDDTKQWFTNYSILVQKPDVSATTKAALDQLAAAKGRAETAATDLATAKQFGGIAAYQAYLQQQALIKAIGDGKVQVVPIPQGGAVNISPK